MTAPPPNANDDRGPHRELHIDRTACAGRGVCATLLAAEIALDEWGFPIQHDRFVDERAGRRAIAACPVLALRFADDGP